MYVSSIIIPERDSLTWKRRNGLLGLIDYTQNVR